MKKLRDQLQEYFLVISSVRDGLPVKEIPTKPDALIKYDQCVAMGIPMIDGGLRDQPHIWLMEYAVCNQERDHEIMLQRAKHNVSSTGSTKQETVPATTQADILRSVGRV